RVIFDFGRGLLTLVPGPEAGAPFGFDGSGLDLCAALPDLVRVEGLAGAPRPPPPRAPPRPGHTPLPARRGAAPAPPAGAGPRRGGPPPGGRGGGGRGETPPAARERHVTDWHLKRQRQSGWGTGGLVSPAVPLPHHRTCGSASGGSES